MTLEILAQAIKEKFSDKLIDVTIKDMVTVELAAENLLSICRSLRDEEAFQFDLLVDICGVDYLEYGLSDWRTDETTANGFSRGKDISDKERIIPWDKPRYGVIYHLLSLPHNHRLRIKVFTAPEPKVPSVMDIWSAADWYEREAFDLFGIVFEGHPNLRRLLTDYGFKGHPFRRSFPLIGELEMRYDAEKKRCIYEPVSINSRVLVPKVIRMDHRYIHTPHEEGNPDA